MLSKITLKKVVCIALLLVLVAYAVIAVLPVGNNFEGKNPMMKEGDMPVLIAHGGGNMEFPDNTLEAFYNAYSVDDRVMMETDVNITRDGVVILSHDTRIDRKTNKSGAIEDWTYEDLISERVDFGYTNETEDEKRISDELIKFKNPDGKEVTPLDVEYPDGVLPRDSEVFLATTLEELIVAFPNNKINVEIKQPGDVGKKAFLASLELCKKYEAFDRIIFASFHNEIYNLFREYQKNDLVPDTFMYSPGIIGVAKFYLSSLFGMDIFFNDGIAVLQLPTDDYYVQLATEFLVERAHDHNIAIQYWTINDREEMKRLIEMGVDGITTDYPHRLKEVYNEYSK